MNLIFATNNLHKLKEVQYLLGNTIHLLSLRDMGYTEELPETGNTLEENALQKAKTVFQKFKINCFADDTGLEIAVLGGKPGIYSARYAGEKKCFKDNMLKVLEEMKGIKKRIAVFRTVIALITKDKEHLFEGRVNGIISEEMKGEQGFGYDPIFIPLCLPSLKGEGGMFREKSYAELSLEEKNRISHRAIAVKKLAEFLNI